MRPANNITLVLFIALITVAVSVQAETDKSTAAGKDAALVNIELKNIPVREAIENLFKGTGRSYFILSGVTGNVVDLKIRGVTFNEALKALTDAAGLQYTLEDGVYTIGPAARTAMASTGQVTGSGPDVTSDKSRATRVEPKTTTAPPVAAEAPSTVIINEAPAPVYYGHPAPQSFNYGYGYPPVYRFGNVNVVGGGWNQPVVVAGGSPYVYGFGPINPPPRGWVSPEVMRFLRGQWAIQQRPYFITPYPY